MDGLWETYRSVGNPLSSLNHVFARHRQAFLERMKAQSMKTALVVGGTGPSGPFLVNGLQERGYTVAIFHRGTHEIPEIPANVEHIHGDPHFRETFDAALAGRTFDVVIATYGRIRMIAEALVGKVGQFIAIGIPPRPR